MFKFVVIAACLVASSQAGVLVGGGSFASSPALGAPLLGSVSYTAPEVSVVKQQVVVDQPEIRYRSVPTIVQTAPIVKTTIAQPIVQQVVQPRIVAQPVVQQVVAQQVVAQPQILTRSAVVGQQVLAQPALTYSGLGLNGLAYNGLGLNGLAYNGLGYNGLAYNGLGLNGLAYNGLGLNGLALNGLNGVVALKK